MIYQDLKGVTNNSKGPRSLSTRPEENEDMTSPGKTSGWEERNFEGNKPDFFSDFSTEMAD